MAKVIDITEKLSFEENPKIRINKHELEVDASATTMLKVMQVMNKGNVGPDDIVEAYNFMFSEKDRKTIEKMNLGFKDFTTLVTSAIELVAGNEAAGE